VYAAEIDGRKLTFQASGSLWQDALVLQDLETESLWSQVSGECIMGELKDKKLELHPARHTTFAEFLADDANGLVLRKPSKGEPRAQYHSYFADSTKLGIFGRADDFERLPGKTIVLGLKLDDRQAAVHLEHLKQEKSTTVYDERGPIVVIHDSESGSSAAFRLPTTDDGKAIPYVISGDRMMHVADERTWDTQTGRLQSGDGQDLDMVPLITAYWFAWVSFFPETELVK
jgi:hypothetical protein